MSVTRVIDVPRVTKPYSEEQWQAILKLGRQLIALLLELAVHQRDLSVDRLDLLASAIRFLAQLANAVLVPPHAADDGDEHGGRGRDPRQAPAPKTSRRAGRWLTIRSRHVPGAPCGREH